MSHFVGGNSISVVTDARDLKRGVHYHFSLEGELPPGLVAMELSSENGWLRFTDGTLDGDTDAVIPFQEKAWQMAKFFREGKFRWTWSP